MEKNSNSYCSSEGKNRPDKKSTASSLKANNPDRCTSFLLAKNYKPTKTHKNRPKADFCPALELVSFLIEDITSLLNFVNS